MRRFVVILLMLLSVTCGFADEKKNEKTQETLPGYIELKDKKHAPNTRSVIIEENPIISIQGMILSFITDLPSCTLQLVDETGNIFYEACIPEGTEEWQLPTNELEGCELRLIIDGVCYYCIL